MRAAQSWLDHRDFSREVVEGAWGQEQGEATVRLAHTVAAPVREGSGVMHHRNGARGPEARRPRHPSWPGGDAARDTLLFSFLAEGCMWAYSLPSMSLSPRSTSNSSLHAVGPAPIRNYLEGTRFR